MGKQRGDVGLGRGICWASRSHTDGGLTLTGELAKVHFHVSVSSDPQQHSAWFLFLSLCLFCSLSLVVALFVLCLFSFFLLLSFKGSLYSLDTHSLSDVCFANIFSQIMACLILTGVFCRAEIFNFNEI